MIRFINFICLSIIITLCSCNRLPAVTPHPFADTPLVTAIPAQTTQVESLAYSFSSIGIPMIDRYPPASTWKQGTIRQLPSFDYQSENPVQIDVRSADLSLMDLHNKWDIIQYAAFDSNTIWPSADFMPPEFDRHQIMEIGKNPGLGVRSLHAQGITGRGVSIAIIDFPLLVEHVEYAERILWYEEISEFYECSASVHGPATTSLAAGETTGVAPGAYIFFFAVRNVDPESKTSGNHPSFKFMAQAVRHIIDLNQQLPEELRIRAISISAGWNPDDSGYDDIYSAVEDATEAGIFVISGRMYLTYDYRLFWLGRYPYDDPDSFDSYGLCVLCGDVSPDDPALDNSLLIPMDSRTVASWTGVEDYAYFSVGGGSWTMPYLAGVYALAVQVDPSITPEDFLDLAAETGRVLEIARGDESFVLGTVIDPVALIEALDD